MQVLHFLGDSARIQTWNLLIRSQMLYSVEPRSHFQIVSAKVLKIIFISSNLPKNILHTLTFL